MAMKAVNENQGQDGVHKDRDACEDGNEGLT